MKYLFLYVKNWKQRQNWQHIKWLPKNLWNASGFQNFFFFLSVTLMAVFFTSETSVHNVADKVHFLTLEKPEGYLEPCQTCGIMYSVIDQINLWKTIFKKFEVIWFTLVDIVVNVDVETNPSINPIRADPWRREI